MLLLFGTDVSVTEVDPKNNTDVGKYSIALIAIRSVQYPPRVMIIALYQKCQNKTKNAYLVHVNGVLLV